MIISKAYDVEIFPNLFSITFVDLKDYLNTFKDCVDAKGKPKALTECLSVSEIKERLDKVSCDIFYISDTDDNQLMLLVEYINKMMAHYDIVDDKRIPVRTDLYGFNCESYDDMMIKAFLMKFNYYDTTKELIKFLYNFSKKIIRLQNDKEEYYADSEIKLVRTYKLPYITVDLQKVYSLHTASVIVDKDGNRNKFGKSLKQTSINLKWHELLDFVLPPCDEEECERYWSKQQEHKGCTPDEINATVTNDFDRYILPKYIEPMLYYNKNDVFICCEIVRQKPDEIKLRYSITHAFGVNVMCSARANIADKLTTKFYSDMSGLNKEDFIKERTIRTKLSFNKIIFPHIKFKTKQLQELLEDMKKVSIYKTSKSEFERTIEFYGTTYTLATGGIHSVDKPGVLKSNDSYVFRHHD